MLRCLMINAARVNCKSRSRLTGTVLNIINRPLSSTELDRPESPAAEFARRHIGPSDVDVTSMLKVCGFQSLDELTAHVIPNEIRLKRELNLEEAISESELLARLEKLMNRNQLWRSYIGQGYYGTLTPSPIVRNIFENPGWYTSYTPYQPEISQGRLEALLNFQTVVSDLTGLPLSNASLLDEGTAAAEALIMASRKTNRQKILVDSGCHPQTIAVVRSRADGLDLELEVMDLRKVKDLEKALLTKTVAGCLMQYPDTEGNVYRDLVETVSKCAKANGSLSVVASDLLALTLLPSPGELGADVSVGSAQRFGVPMGFGGPHAGFFSTRQEFARSIPGRMVGLSKDGSGKPALRLTLQVREQHIRRDKATSNICTAQALLANMASFYAVYHGPIGLKQIATRVHRNTIRLASALSEAGYQICNDKAVFDTLTVRPPNEKSLAGIQERAGMKQINLRYYPDGKQVGISLDETVNSSDFEDILFVFGAQFTPMKDESDLSLLHKQNLLRSDDYLSQPVFHTHQSETELVRYMKQLENKDVSLTHSMISLGSCTMKLNATTGLMPCSWPSVNSLHPFVPQEQTEGFTELITELEQDLAEITGYDHVCLAPNSGAQGEYSGLRAIAGYLKSKGETKRKVCLVPTSAHGTNPASARMSGMTVQPVNTTREGIFDMEHLKKQLDKFHDSLAAIMITYPSTFGVFDSELLRTCELVHQAGGQVYLDGANLNAQVGLCRPGDYNTDVCHLNLHKTFGIPHGGGGPGVGPVCAKAHLAPFLPTHPYRQSCLSVHMDDATRESTLQTVSSAPFGSASILPIPWAYIKLLGRKGVGKSTKIALLNANYMMTRLKEFYSVKYVNENGRCAHEFIVDCSPFEKYHIATIDIAKRLMDYGFHSPTMSWPVASSLMIEPTESESRAECDRLCDALIHIRKEIDRIVSGEWSVDSNPLKLAPHTLEDVTQSDWNRPYTRQEAAFPAPWHHGDNSNRLTSPATKVWPSVGRLDDAYGDTHLSCKMPLRWD